MSGGEEYKLCFGEMQPDIMAAIITALINFTRVWEGETAVAAGDRERERERERERGENILRWLRARQLVFRKLAAKEVRRPRG